MIVQYGFYHACFRKKSHPFLLYLENLMCSGKTKQRADFKSAQKQSSGKMYSMIKCGSIS